MDISELRHRRNQILAITDKYGAEDVRIFGSVARGDATASSDVDFLVRYRPGTSLMDAAAIWTELQELLGCKVDLVSERTIPPYARHIFQEAVPI